MYTCIGCACGRVGVISDKAYLGFEKSQRSVTHDFLSYIYILTYLLTYVYARTSLHAI